MSLSRADRSGFAAWWWTIDRVAFFAMLALIAIGLMLAFAASPAATGGPLTRRRFPLRRQADRVRRRSRACILGGHLAAVARARSRLSAAIVFALARDRLGARAVHRQRSAGRETLDRFRLDDAAAVGIPQARLRGARRRDPRRQARRCILPQGTHHVSSDRARAGRAAAAARCRPDGIAAGVVGRAAVLHRALARSGSARSRAARPGWACWPICCFPMCATASMQFLDPHASRLSDGSGAEGVRAWRLDRRRPRRGHDQISHSRRAFRFHLRGRGRGIRSRAVRR